MAHVDFTPSSADISPDTAELAVELAEKKIDAYRVRWLIEDCGADIMRAMSMARLKEQDLLKNPVLKPLGLQRYLHTRH